MQINDFLRRLDGVRGGGDQYTARCPCHDDKQNSLSVGVGDDGSILLHCHAGCAAADIVRKLGFDMKDLFQDGEKPMGGPEAVYTYCGQDGKPLQRKTKIRKTDGSKYFYWEKLDGGKWVKGRSQRMMYISGPLGRYVYFVEGEKDVDTLKALGQSAVSLPDGAGSKWEPQYTDVLRGKGVIILPDNDHPGQEYAQMVAASLHGVAAFVKVLELTAAWPEMPEKADISDLLRAMGKDAGWSAVMKLTAATPEWAPKKQGFLSCFKTLDNFVEKEANWLIPGWIPAGQIAILAADGGTGKTTLWNNFTAAISNGGCCILDPPGYSREPQKVLFLSTEDSVEMVLKRRLRLAGANFKNILAPDFASDDAGELRGLKFGSPQLEQLIADYRPSLCVFDPVQGFIPPDTNMGARNEMRDKLQQLIPLGEKYGTTFLIVCHSNKRPGASGRDRIADSADLWDIARSVMMCGYDDANGVRYLSNEKNNYGPLQETVLFSIDKDGVAHKEGSTWKRDYEYRLESTARSKAKPKAEDCKEFILSALDEAGGAMPSTDLDAKAAAAGYSVVMVKRSKSALKESRAISYFSTGSSKGGDKTWHIRLEKSSVFFDDLTGGTTPFDTTSPSEIQI